MPEEGESMPIEREIRTEDLSSEEARSILGKEGRPSMAGGAPWLYEKEEQLKGLDSEVVDIVHNLEAAKNLDLLETSWIDMAQNALFKLAMEKRIKLEDPRIQKILLKIKEEKKGQEETERKVVKGKPLIVKEGEKEEGEEAEAIVLLPEYVGAIFKQGRNARTGLIKEGRGISLFDVKLEKDREAMLFRNLGTFGYSVSNPEVVWKKAVDYYINDLKSAALDVGLDRNSLAKTEQEIKTMMAVTASARAMEKSGGSFEKYAAYITQSAKPDYDKADAWRDYLIHDDKDEGKLKRVKDYPSVKPSYDRLTKDVERGRASELTKFLTTKKPEGALPNWRYQGMDEYISKHLLRNESPNATDYLGKFAAAKLATDVFLIDEYTRWEFNIDPEGELKLRPSPDWGGDPLRAVIEPSVLPRRVKGMYRENPELLDGIDATFRLDDIASRNAAFAEEQLRPTMTEGLKKLSRYFDALNAFLGDTRGTSIPSWGKDTLTKDLPTIVDKMDQVYGEIKDDHKTPVGKHLMGLIIARVIALKASAAVLESAKPNFADRLAYLTEAKGGEYFTEAREFLFGPKFDSTEGFLYQCSAGRTRIVFRGNMFPGIGELVTSTKNMLEFNVATDKIDKEIIYRKLKGALIILQGLGAEKIRR